jgi:hypothetical protein
MEAFVAGVELWQKFLLVLEPIRVFFGSNRTSSRNGKNRTPPNRMKLNEA